MKSDQPANSERLFPSPQAASLSFSFPNGPFPAEQSLLWFTWKVESGMLSLGMFCSDGEVLAGCEAELDLRHSGR